MDLPILEDFKNIELQNQFNNILSSNAKYLVHEYLNQSYEPFDFAKLAAELSQAKLQFASPAHFARLLKPSYFLDKATLNKLNETSPIMQAEKELLKLSFIYVGKEISYKRKAMGKTFTMHQHVYEPIFEAFKDHSMVSTKEIQDILQAKHSSDRFNQAIIIEENQYAYYLNHLVSPISTKGIYLNKKRASRF
ncbi:methyltransferase regulatory domain-containing protein [Helicobacter pylori]|uniref:methyltransferase regulatory domain-containing protein n=1 Tax=Helicobacter pylori TaxID=210 RepID=UPI001FD3365D|nr:methyltransferase regulatory domain-containing protein [Helicobacter pylori]UOR94126.1 methyltransferase regulatory domain-containing protein [Helicobacter pylori]UOR95550.1 methyltransferase regulatory domain-containing protein [Helicobacter pylori]